MPMGWLRPEGARYHRTLPVDVMAMSERGWLGATRPHQSLSGKDTRSQKGSGSDPGIYTQGTDRCCGIVTGRRDLGELVESFENATDMRAGCSDRVEVRDRDWDHLRLG